MVRRGRPPKNWAALVEVKPAAEESGTKALVVVRDFDLFEVNVEEGKMDDLGDYDSEGSLLLKRESISQDLKQVAGGDHQAEAKPYLEVVQRGRANLVEELPQNDTAGNRDVRKGFQLS
ncbi:hypothetical protein Dimus_034613 [Dionaea muscipula]